MAPLWLRGVTGLMMPVSAAGGDRGGAAGERGPSSRASGGSGQGAAFLVQPFLEDAVLQLLHPQVGLLHLLLVGILLAQLVQLQLCRL